MSPAAAPRRPRKTPSPPPNRCGRNLLARSFHDPWRSPIDPEGRGLPVLAATDAKLLRLPHDVLVSYHVGEPRCGGCLVQHLPLLVPEVTEVPDLPGKVGPAVVPDCRQLPEHIVHLPGVLVDVLRPEALQLGVPEATVGEVLPRDDVDVLAPVGHPGLGVDPSRLLVHRAGLDVDAVGHPDVVSAESPLPGVAVGPARPVVSPELDHREVDDVNVRREPLAEVRDLPVVLLVDHLRSEEHTSELQSP